MALLDTHQSCQEILDRWDWYDVKILLMQVKGKWEILPEWSQETHCVVIS